MANNLFANIPAACVAKTTVSFSTIGAINSTSIKKIFEAGSPVKSFVPGSGFNSLTGFTQGKGYWIEPKTNLDLSDILIPPIPTGGGGGTPVTVASMVATDSGHIRVTFSAARTGVNGFTFKQNGSVMDVASQTEISSTVVDYNMLGFLSAGTTITADYTPGDIASSGGALAGFTGASVTNSISGGGSTNPLTVSGSALTVSGSNLTVN